jgi:protein TonB
MRLEQQTTPQRQSLAPSMLAAVALHVLVLLSGLFVWPWSNKPIQMVNATAVTLVSSTPAPPPPAVQAPEEQTAAAPEPTPTPAPPMPPPPKPQPKPTPEPPKPAPPPPKPTPVPTPKPTPQPPKPKPKEQSLDLNALSSSLDKSAKTAPKAKPTKESFDLNALASSLDKSSKPQASTRGPARNETALTARNTTGTQATTDLIGAISGRIIRLWHPDCGGIGARDVTVDIRVVLGPDGSLQSATPAGGTGPSAVLQAAKDRAQLAVGQAAPYQLPRQTYNEWRSFTVHFDAKQICGG